MHPRVNEVGSPINRVDNPRGLVGQLTAALFGHRFLTYQPLGMREGERKMRVRMKTCLLPISSLVGWELLPQF